jgi:hypothetical protein
MCHFSKESTEFSYLELGRISPCIISERYPESCIRKESILVAPFNTSWKSHINIKYNENIPTEYK